MERPVLSTGTWKVLLAIVAVFVTGLLATELWYAPRTLAPGGAGTLGMSYHELPQWGRSRYVIDSLAPDSPVLAAGAQIDDIWIPDRFYDAHRRLEAHEPIGMTMIRGDSATHVTVTTLPADARSSAVGAYVLTWCVSFLCLIAGLLIASRRPDSVASRSLGFWFIFSTAFYAIQSYLILPAGPAFVVYHLCWPGGRVLAGLCFLIFVFNFPDDQPRGTALKRWLFNYTVAPFMVLYSLTAIAMAVHAGGYHAPLLPLITACGFGAWFLMIVVIMWNNWRTSTGEMRDRHLWILPFALVMCMQPVVEVLRAQSHGFASSTTAPTVVRLIALLTLVMFVYGVVRHRVLSIGFAINRVVVYSFASIAMLLTFGIIEWAAHHLLEFAGREKSVLLDGAIALGVFLVFHRVRNAGESLIERLFFHAWHVKEEALRSFVKEAPFITRPEALLTAFTTALDRFTDGAGYALYRRTPSGDYVRVTATLADSPEHVDADEPLAVVLRANQAPAYCQDAHSSLPGELALPSGHHGELDGFIVLGSKPNGETYRPDEKEVLGYAAHQVGLDFRALRMEQLEREVTEQSARIRDLSARLEPVARMYDHFQ